VRRRLLRGDLLLAALPPVLTAASLVGTGLAPLWLTRRPLALIALAPRYPFLAVAAARVPPGPFFAVAFARLVAADVPYFVLARRHGPRVARASRRWAPAARAHDGCARLFDKVGLVLVAASPTAKVLTLAGMSDLPAARVAAADAAGTVAQLAALYGLGRAGPSVLLVLVGLAAVGLAAAGLAAALSRIIRLPRAEEAPACGYW
jgi:membrane protein DedA with SNARE-associated domain